MEIFKFSCESLFKYLQTAIFGLIIRFPLMNEYCTAENVHMEPKAPNHDQEQVYFIFRKYNRDEERVFGYMENASPNRNKVTFCLMQF